jgi:WG containing repeat
MKSILCISLLLSVWLPVVLHAQDERELFPISVNGKVGYIDTGGRVVIKPQFDTADWNGHFDEEQYFKEGLAVVSEAERGGFIDKMGRFVIEGPYYPRGHFSNGLARVSDHKNYGPYDVGFMDRTGKFVIPPRFSRAEDFSEGLAVVQIKDKWGYIDETGRMLIPARFNEAESFKNGFALVNISGVKRGYINKAGRFMPMPDEVEAFGRLADGLIAVKVEGKWGFMNTLGQIVIAPQFDPDIGEYGDDIYYRTFAVGLALVKSKGKWGYINKSGKYVIAARFDKANPFESGLARVSVKEKWGLINRSGEFVVPPTFERVESFAEGLAVVSIDGKKFGYINAGGQLVIAPQFTGATAFSEGLASAQVAVRKGSEIEYLWGYIDRSGRFVIKPQFISAGVFDRGLARQTISEFLGIPAPSPGFHDEWGYIDRTGRFVWKSTNRIMD